MTVNIQLEQNELPAFLACLGIGTLVAMQKGQLEAEAGIWAMGAPRVWEPIEDNIVQKDILEVFQQSDELATLQQLAPESYQEELEQMINQLSDVLSRMQKPIWSLRWGTQKEAKPAFERKNQKIQELMAGQG